MRTHGRYVSQCGPRYRVALAGGAIALVSTLTVLVAPVAHPGANAAAPSNQFPETVQIGTE